MAAVPWGEWRTVLVYRRQYQGRTFIRLRTWNKHRKLLVWYPSDRFFVIPIDNAAALADAIRAAAEGVTNPSPDRLYAWEEEWFDLSEDDEDAADDVDDMDSWPFT